jgi:hypothetical protein
LKKYLSEKAAMERLKNSIIKKSYLEEFKPAILSPKEKKIRRIYRFALDNRGGEFEELQADNELSNEAFNLAQNIKSLVERLAASLKKRELNGVAKIFFKNSRLILELILYNCNIGISYAIIKEGLNAQIIIITVSVGGTAGFILSWFSAGIALVGPPAVISFFLLRSSIQQILNQRDYLKFKKTLDKMLDDDKLKETIQAFFMESEKLTPSSVTLKLESLDFDEKSALKHNFNLKSDEGFEEFIKSKMEKELGLIENPTKEQLQEIIQKKVNKKSRGKIVFFEDFIKENPYQGADLSHSDIIDAEILEKLIRMESDNEL